jgi:hypothetical protein
LFYWLALLTDFTNDLLAVCDNGLHQQVEIPALAAVIGDRDAQGECASDARA